MQVSLGLCYYCEASKEEIIALGLAETAEESLSWASVGDSKVLLCPACRARYAPFVDDDLARLTDAPIDFPPGVTAIQHSCPELAFLGQESLKIVELHYDGEKYYTATCPHCGVVVRSLPGD